MKTNHNIQVRFAILLIFAGLILALCGAGGAPLISKPVVCIDPGHPSEVNSGRTMQNGLTELDVNWDVALELKKILTTNHIYAVITKGEKHTFVTNKKRAEIANEAKALLFLRLHCDTEAVGKNGKPTKTGFTLYYPDRKGTKDNKIGPPDNIIAESRKAANLIHEGMIEILKGVLKDNGVIGESATLVGSKQGALTGSIFSKVPAVTVEMIFLGNPSDAAFIGSENGRRNMARALARGVVLYLGSAELRNPKR